MEKSIRISFLIFHTINTMDLRSKSRAACEESWKHGMPLKETYDGFPIVMKPSMNCMFRVQGTQDIAYVGMPGSNKPNATPEEKEGFKAQVRAFLSGIPRLSVEAMDSAPEGIYTWILYSDGSGVPPTFVASQTETMLELGTVHYSIATSVGAKAVHGAGELWKHGNEYTVNFLSGTFMQSWKLPPVCPLPTMEFYLRNKLQKEVFPELFRGKTLSFTKAPFVTSRLLEKELTTARLEDYVRAGFVVCVYDKSQESECKATKSMCKKPVTLEAMKGGQENLAVTGKTVPLTPRKKYLEQKDAPAPVQSQASLARQVFASQGLIAPQNLRSAKERALATLKRPVSPGSVGLGRRTRRLRRKNRRVTKKSK